MGFGVVGRSQLNDLIVGLKNRGMCVFESQIRKRSKVEQGKKKELSLNIFQSIIFQLFNRENITSIVFNFLSISSELGLRVILHPKTK